MNSAIKIFYGMLLRRIAVIACIPLVSYHLAWFVRRFLWKGGDSPILWGEEVWFLAISGLFVLIPLLFFLLIVYSATVDLWEKSKELATKSQSK